MVGCAYFSSSEKHVFVEHPNFHCQQLLNVVQLHSTVSGVVNVGGGERRILGGGW